MDQRGKTLFKCYYCSLEKSDFSDLNLKEHFTHLAKLVVFKRRMIYCKREDIQ